MYDEILELKSMLEGADIPFKFSDLFDGYHLEYPTSGDGRVCSVIEHGFSYGNEDDKLEIMGLLTEDESTFDSVAGGLSAENVFSRIKDHHSHKED